MTWPEYHAALLKVRESPIDLTEYDFRILADFGGARDEARGRDALKRAQLRLVGAHGTVHTNAAARVVRPPTTADAIVVDAIETAVRAALAPVETRLDVLETRAADVRARHAAIAALGPCAAVARQVDQQRATFADAVRADGFETELTAADPRAR